MRYLYVLVLNAFIYSCSSVSKKYIVNNNLCNYNDSIFRITHVELTLSQNILNQLKNKEGSLTMIDNDTFKSRFYTLNSKQITNKQTSKQLGIGK